MNNNKFNEFAAVGDAKISGALIWEYFMPIIALACYFSGEMFIYAGLSVPLALSSVIFIISNISSRPRLCVFLVATAITLSCHFGDIFIGMNISTLVYSAYTYLVTTLIMLKTFPGVCECYVIIAVGFLSVYFHITILECLIMVAVIFTLWKWGLNGLALGCDIIGGLLSFGYVSHLSANGTVPTSMFENIVIGVVMMQVTEIFYRTIYTREYLLWLSENGD